MMNNPPFDVLRRHAPRVLAILTFTVPGLSACTELTEYTATTNRYGAVSIAAKATSATTVSATAYATFFEAINAAVPNSASQRSDACAFTSYDTIGTVQRGLNQAGDAITLNVGAATTSLPYDAANLRYATPAGQRFSYSTGDAARATIPGSVSFPSSNIAVRLAEPVLPGPVTAPTVGQPVVVTWNAATDSASAMIIALRYVLGSGANAVPEQVYCSARDDGRFDIPSSSLTSFLASPASSRSLVLTRFRTNQALLNDSTLLFIGTTVDTTILLR